MLDEPITQADVDRKQLFRTRGGGTAHVVEHYPDFENYKWMADYSDGGRITVNDCGLFVDCMRPNHRDLIARIPKEDWIVAIANSLPDEAIAGIPIDGATNHDHYLYGSPKRQEPDMKSQVVVVDRRNECSDAACMHSFASYHDGSILQPGGGEIYLKVGDGRVLQLTGADAGNFYHMAAGTPCKQKMHIRTKLYSKTATNRPAE